MSQYTNVWDGAEIMTGDDIPMSSWAVSPVKKKIPAQPPNSPCPTLQSRELNKSSPSREVKESSPTQEVNKPSSSQEVNKPLL